MILIEKEKKKISHSEEYIQRLIIPNSQTLHQYIFLYNGVTYVVTAYHFVCVKTVLLRQEKNTNKDRNLQNRE